MSIYINDLWPQAFADESKRCSVAVAWTAESFAAIEALDASVARHFTWGNVALTGADYVEMSLDAALWAMRTSMYAAPRRMSRAFNDAYEWEAAERARVAA